MSIDFSIDDDEDIEEIKKIEYCSWEGCELNSNEITLADYRGKKYCPEHLADKKDQEREERLKKKKENEQKEKEKEELEKQQQIKREELEKIKKQADDFEEKSQKLGDLESKIEELEQNISTMTSNNKVLSQTVEKIRGENEELKLSLDLISEEQDESFKKEMILRDIISQVKKNVKTLNLSNNDLKKLYIKNYNEMAITDRVIELDWQKVKDFILNLNKDDLGGKFYELSVELEKLNKRVKDGRQRAFIQPFFQFLNEYVLNRKNITNFLKPKYVDKHIVPLDLDSITLNIAQQYLEDFLDDLLEKSKAKKN